MRKKNIKSNKKYTKMPTKRKKYNEIKKYL